MNTSMAKTLGLIAALQLGLVTSPNAALASSRSSLDAGALR